MKQMRSKFTATGNELISGNWWQFIMYIHTTLDFHTVSNAGSRGKPSRVCVSSWSVLHRKRIHCASSRGDFFACADPAGTKTNFLFYFSPLMPFLAAKGWITVCSTNKLCEYCNMDISVQYKWQKEKKMTLWSFHKVGISCATDTWEATRAHILYIHTVQSTVCTYYVHDLLKWPHRIFRGNQPCRITIFIN